MSTCSIKGHVMACLRGPVVDNWLCRIPGYTYLVIPGYLVITHNYGLWVWGYAAPRSGAKLCGHEVMLWAIPKDPFITLTP